MSSRRDPASLASEAGGFGGGEPGPPPLRGLTAVVVDHEPLAREWLRRSLALEGAVEVVAECADGDEAIREVALRAPDLVFLEVDLAGRDGFEVLASCGAGPGRRPEFVFVTADESHAVRAFEAGVLDYILKPVDGDRVVAAVRRARRLREEALTAGVREVLPVLMAARRERVHPEWLLVKQEGRSVFVQVSDVDWVESARNNVVLHVGSRRYVLRETTAAMEKRLDPRRFLRIHRSTIVQIARVHSLEPWFNGEYRVTLKDGTKLTLSESYRDRLKEFRSPRATRAVE
jgi:two-component system LytT family response regulator